MKRWKLKNEPPTLNDSEIDEASSTELESQTVRLSSDKPGAKNGVVSTA